MSNGGTKYLKLSVFKFILPKKADKISTFTQIICMPLSYIVYGSVTIVIITILLYLFTKRKNR